MNQEPPGLRGQSLRCQILIPARLESTRLPRKLLLNETGKPLIQHTYESALKAGRPLGVCVAADDDLICRQVREFGGNAELTDPALASGTDRVAQLARNMDDIDVIVNVQGDEPEVSGEAIDLAIQLLQDDPRVPMSTLATPIRDQAQLLDPSCVKVVFDSLGHALYFSRSPIPAVRTWKDSLLGAKPAHFYQHVGLYAYRREFLLQLADLPPSEIEKLESLEQLRVLWHGYKILVGVVDEPTMGIDTREDYEAFVRRAGKCQTP